jgi:hypothetical protein
MTLTTSYLNNLVLLGLINLAGQAAARESVVDDKLVGLEAGLFEEFWTFKYKATQAICGRTNTIQNSMSFCRMWFPSSY